MRQYIALFTSARKVVQADERCRESQLPATIISVPKHYSSECGMCLRIEEKDKTRFEQLMSSVQITYQLHPDEKL